ncbi:hypothetical protein ACIBH1_14955 [Nonomuraea sp. NPDC050663]|uniref:hypothetical protein n=1 Tax=Nonomuraea sp. NPDC050663 TaxID=3364370 RepID=UPI0037B45A9A
MKRTITHLSAAAAVALTGLCVTAAPASAAPACSAPEWPPDTTDGFAVIKGDQWTSKFNLKKAPYSHCGNSVLMWGGDKLELSCYMYNDYGNKWYYGWTRYGDNYYKGWMSAANLEWFTGWSGGKCVIDEA